MSPPSRRRQHGVNATASPVNLGDASQPLRQAVIRVLLATTLVALIVGAMAWLLGAHDVAGICWAAGTSVAIVSAVWWVLAALRRGRVGRRHHRGARTGGYAGHSRVFGGRVDRVMLATGRRLKSPPSVARPRISDRYWSVPHALRVDGQRAACRRCRSSRSPSVMRSWWVPAKFVLWMRWSLRIGRFSTSRRSPVNPSTMITEGPNGAQWSGQCRWGRGDSRHSDGGWEHLRGQCANGSAGRGGNRPRGPSRRSRRGLVTAVSARCGGIRLADQWIG